MQWAKSYDVRAAFMKLYDLAAGRVDYAGWPTRDAAAPEEGC
jgi:hypothetical protein